MTCQATLEIGKRKLRLQEQPDQVSLLPTKRAKSKSKSPPSGDGSRTAAMQAGASEERSMIDPPREHDQVSTIIVFG